MKIEREREIDSSGHKRPCALSVGKLLFRFSSYAATHLFLVPVPPPWTHLPLPLAHCLWHFLPEGLSICHLAASTTQRTAPAADKRPETRDGDGWDARWHRTSPAQQAMTTLPTLQGTQQLRATQILNATSANTMMLLWRKRSCKLYDNSALKFIKNSKIRKKKRENSIKFHISSSILMTLRMQSKASIFYKLHMIVWSIQFSWGRKTRNK